MAGLRLVGDTVCGERSARRLDGGVARRTGSVAAGATGWGVGFGAGAGAPSKSAGMTSAGRPAAAPVAGKVASSKGMARKVQRVAVGNACLRLKAADRLHTGKQRSGCGL
ncbi:hypothetical protein [Denitromonas sp.]|uniref:hypothetical protein n=1 Tax=Denitromonas sp. TaxID=2734609 RepID=UPI003A858632